MFPQTSTNVVCSHRSSIDCTASLFAYLNTEARLGVWLGAIATIPEWQEIDCWSCTLL